MPCGTSFRNSLSRRPTSTCRMPASGHWPTAMRTSPRRHLHANIFSSVTPAQPLPLYSIVGGKLTTCRSLAEETAATLLADLGRPRVADSRERTIPGGEAWPADRGRAERRTPRNRPAERPAAGGGRSCLATGRHAGRRNSERCTHPAKAVSEERIFRRPWPAGASAMNGRPGWMT